MNQMKMFNRRCFEAD